jgi:methyl-accepting chemotaxis protein
LAQSSDDLAERTEQQAAFLEETAAAMHELTVTVRQNANNAEHANKLASEARTSAVAGGAIVAPTVDAMTKIEESSERIAAITEVIEEIAFQTSLLALNAAVEAARAGDAGNGFAVVASEVRALAQRSAEASKEIKELIRQSGRQVKQGVNLVNQTGESLKQIVDTVQTVAETVAEITAATREQSTGLEEINTAVGQMDQTTQQNALLVEQARDSARAMVNQARSLLQTVSTFRTGEDTASIELELAASSSTSAPPLAPRPQAARPAIGAHADDKDWSGF